MAIRLETIASGLDQRPWFAERAWQDRLLVLHTDRKALINFPNVDQHLTRFDPYSLGQICPRGAMPPAS